MYKAKIIATNEELIDIGIDPELFPDRECIGIQASGVTTIFPEGKEKYSFSIPEMFLKIIGEYDSNKDSETLQRIKDALYAARTDGGVLTIPPEMVLHNVYEILEGR